SLPDAIAAFIDWLVRHSGWKVTERERPGEPVAIAARHVCILFRRFRSFDRDMTRPYARALEARGLPHLLVGGGSFHQREEAATRAHAAFAIWPTGEQALANVARLLDLARRAERRATTSFRGFVQQLEDDAEEGEAREAPIFEEGTEGVRIMTVHRAKGLEFP